MISLEFNCHYSHCASVFFVSFSIYYSYLNQSDNTRLRTMSLLSLGQPRIGEAAATFATNVAANKIHDALRRRRGLPVFLAVEEIEGENLEFYFTTLSEMLAKTPIPIKHNFDVDLNPTNANSRRCCVTSTLLQYIG